MADGNGKRILTAKAVREQEEAHWDYYREARRALNDYDLAYQTRFWDGTSSSGYNDGTQIRIEVNRLYRFVEAMLNAIYPKSNVVAVGSTGGVGGDPAKTQIAVGSWLGQRKMRSRFKDLIRQAFTRPMSGVVFGVDSNRKRKRSPADRVWFQVIPAWEILLDREATDETARRFQGRVGWHLKEHVEQRFGLQGRLKGTSRSDFLRSYGDGDSRRESDAKRAASDQNAWVKVVEITNFVDDYDDEHCGMFEVYIYGEEAVKWDEPVYTGPVPFSRRDGSPLPHVLPLIFTPRPGYPFQGIPPVSRVWPQIVEQNILRSFRANATRKNTRQYGYDPNIVSDDSLSRLNAGVDGAGVQINFQTLRQMGMSPQDAIIPIKWPDISNDLSEYEQQIMQDLQVVEGPMGPGAFGEVTKASATEVIAIRQPTESEQGKFADVLLSFIADFSELYVRALVAAMAAPVATSYGTSEADTPGVDDPEIMGDEPPRKDGGKEAFEKQAEEAEALLEGAGKEREDEEEEEDPADSLFKSTEDEEEDVEDEPSEEVEPEAEVLYLRDGVDVVEITVDDLDGDFVFEHVESRQSPMTQAAVRQALVAPQIVDRILQLWQVQVDPKAPAAMKVFARTLHEQLVEQFDLPEVFKPAMLEQEARKEEEDMATKGQDVPPEPPAMAPAGPGGPSPAEPPGGGGAKPQPPPGGPPPAPAQGPTEDLRLVLDAFLQGSLDGAQAVDMLARINQQLNDPSLASLLEQVMALPPEQRGEALRQALGRPPGTNAPAMA